MVVSPTQTFKTTNIEAGHGKIITSTGHWFDVYNPKPEDIYLEDISHALSNQPRFTGHTNEFYSVAQHSVLASRNCPSIYAFEGLMHDASEAYLSDIARPIKKHPSLRDIYSALEDRLTQTIFEYFELEYPIPQEVMDTDNILLRTEARDLMPSTFPEYPGEVLTEEIIPWTPKRAKREFLKRFTELS